ncbi:hypothetical protein GQ42DRAFT_77565 [Ramicandelaber brevisporus]|nr:hypothetical protein GQ42DRAFT_77565 [Ramicandelaber brevisporus]
MFNTEPSQTEKKKHSMATQARGGGEKPTEEGTNQERGEQMEHAAGKTRMDIGADTKTQRKRETRDRREHAVLERILRQKRIQWKTKVRGRERENRPDNDGRRHTHTASHSYTLFLEAAMFTHKPPLLVFFV